MTDKLQLMLINELLDQFLHAKVSHGSVATLLSCDAMKQDICSSIIHENVM